MYDWKQNEILHDDARWNRSVAARLFWGRVLLYHWFTTVAGPEAVSSQIASIFYWFL